MKEDKKKLEIIKREMSELERVLEWNGFSEEEPCGPFDRPKHILFLNVISFITYSLQVL